MFIFQDHFIKTLFCLGFLNPEFSRIFGWILESSFLFSFLVSSSFVHSLEEGGPQTSPIALPRAHCGVCTKMHTCVHMHTHASLLFVVYSSPPLIASPFFKSLSPETTPSSFVSTCPSFPVGIQAGWKVFVTGACHALPFPSDAILS